MVEKLSSKRTISAACLATSVPVGPPMAIPTSAFLKAAASLTPSPRIYKDLMVKMIVTGFVNFLFSV